jgi:hypothetical protein
MVDSLCEIVDRIRAAENRHKVVGADVGSGPSCLWLDDGRAPLREANQRTVLLSRASASMTRTDVRSLQ